MVIRIRRNEPCPCGSAVKAKKCCLKADGRCIKRPAVVVPAGQVTNFSHPRCFANADHNCSPTISGEHFISKNVLGQLGTQGTAKIAGLKWQEAQRFNVLPIPALAPRILCTRHNEALSPLDATIGYFFQTLQHYDDALHPSAKASPDEARLFSGEDLERWMLKCLLGSTKSNNLSSRLKPECLDLLYSRKEWDEGWGLYIPISKDTLYHSDSLAIETVVAPDQTTLLARFVFRGLSVYLCMGKPDTPSSLGVWRPSEIILENTKIKKVIVMSWEKHSSVSFVRLTRQGSYDGPPPDWQPWEKEQ
jgi:hypothetical protein